MLNMAIVPMLFILISSVLTQQDSPQVEILVPTGMPIEMKVSNCEIKESFTRFKIERKVPKEAKSATFIIVMVGKDGKLLSGEGSILRFKSMDLSDPMTIATGDQNVAKIIITVETIVTQEGKWVPNNQERMIPLNAVIERGKLGLPNAILISSPKP